MDHTKMLSPSQVAEKLGVSRQRVDIWLRTGRIPYVELGPLRYVRPQDAKRPEPQKPGRKVVAVKAIRRAKKSRK